MAKPRTTPPSAPKTVQDGKPTDVPAVTEEKPAGAPPTPGGSVPEQSDGQLQSAEAVASAADGAAIGQLPPAAPEADQVAGVETGTSSADAVFLGAVAAPATSTDENDDASNSWCFEVLSPFKHNGVVVKPPAWIQMTWNEAEDYQDAGVLGDEPAAPEELE